MASECESRLFWSIFLLSRVSPSASFSTPHGHTSSRSPVLKRSLGTPLILYSQSIYFRGSPLEFLSFPARRSRYRLSLCSAGIHSSHAIPGETRQFSLFLSLFIFLFYMFYIYFFRVTPPGFFSLRYPSKYAYGTQYKICPMHENKIICTVACKNKETVRSSKYSKRYRSLK